MLLSRAVCAVSASAPFIIESSFSGFIILSLTGMRFAGCLGAAVLAADGVSAAAVRAAVSLSTVLPYTFFTLLCADFSALDITLLTSAFISASETVPALSSVM